MSRANPFAHSPGNSIALFERLQFARTFLQRTQPFSPQLALIERTLARDSVDAIFKAVQS